VDNFGEQKKYDIEYIGSYGHFSSGDSFPVEYLMTSLSMSELDDLSFARDIRPETLDFDLLMQRDIDEERVRRDMEPYLNPNLTDEEIRSKVIFFPPLLVAIVPTKEKAMQKFYPDEVCIKIGTDNDEKFVREWRNIFKLTFFPDNPTDGYKINTVIDGKLKGEYIKVAPVKLETRSTKGNREGASLIVIDGQHRLFALREVYKKRPDLIGDLIVPVCILYSPNSTEFMEKRESSRSVPTVPEVFRHLFVDVNTTMELVGGHFNILLSDDSIGSLACRGFCDFILRRESKSGLAVLEWNTKSKKDSTIIKRPRSLTKIGVIEQGLREVFTRGRDTQINRMKYILQMDEISDDLYSEEDEDAYQKLEWDRFSLRQKKLLDKQVKKHLIPALYSIYYETEPFKQSLNIFKKELEKIEKMSDRDSEDKLEAIIVLEELLDYIPIKSSENNTSSLLLLQKFENSIDKIRKEETPDIIRYALFHRAIFQVWGKLIDQGREIKYEINIENVTKALVYLLNTSLKNKGFAFQSTKIYMQHSVFEVTKIKATNATRDALSWIILSYLGNRDVAKKICNHLNVKDEFSNELIEYFVDLGRLSSSRFIKHYTKNRKKAFISRYQIDFATLSQDEIEELQDLQNKELYQMQQVKNGDLKRSEVELVFDKKINQYVHEDVSRAALELKNTLAYDADIILEDSFI